MRGRSPEVRRLSVAARGILITTCLCVSSWSCTDSALRAKSSDSDEVKQRAIAAMCAENKSSYPSVPELSPEEAVEMQAAGKVVFVDVRELEEFTVSHIAGAIHVDTFDKATEQYRGTKVIAYCTIGYRSGLYAAKLRKKGIDAYNLDGSILSWVHAGRPIVDKDGETKRLHVYGRKWDLVPAGYESLW